MIESIKKRDGRVAAFDPQKIEQAIEKSFMASGNRKGRETARRLAGYVCASLENDETIPAVPTVEQVQDAVERTLIEQGFVRSAKAYILYRAERSRVREMDTCLMKTFAGICFPGAEGGGTADASGGQAEPAMHAMQTFGSEGAKQFYEMFVLNPKFAQAHRDGELHIHGLDYYALTTGSTQMDLARLLSGGFTAGGAVLREPQDIQSCAALCCIAIQANQNDQNGWQSIVNFDYAMAAGVRKTYQKRFREHLACALELLVPLEDVPDKLNPLLDALIADTGKMPALAADAAFDKALKARLKTLGAAGKELPDRIVEFARSHAETQTGLAVHQAMEALVHTLNAVHSRAGAQPPLSAVNFGLDTSPEGRMAARNLLLAAEEGLGNGEAAAYPMLIFRVKEGVNYTPGDPNYDLFRLAVRVCAKRLTPRFSFLDAPYNLPYYRPGDQGAHAAYAGDRTCVMGNVHDPECAGAARRGTLSLTTVNLPRIAVKAKGDVGWFFEALERLLELTVGQLMERFEIIARKPANSFPFLMGQGLWLNAETLQETDPVRGVIRHGVLSIGFVGLAEALNALLGKHHGESAAAQNLGLEIVGFIRKYCDEISEKYGMNFTCAAAPAGEAARRFAQLDRERFGTLKGVTDGERYTDSFHIPVSCAIPQPDRLALEAPYHALANGGHISLAQIGKESGKTLDAVETLLRQMHDLGIGHCALTHTPDGEV